MVWVETPTNPLTVYDIAAVAKITKANNILFAIPLQQPHLQNPLDLGVDVVMHSTKYLAGHSDVVAGALITKTAELKQLLFNNLLLSYAWANGLSRS
jgi:cystathionine beta-lyase